MRFLRTYLKNPRLWQIALACYWALLFISTHIPIDRKLLSGGKLDKLAHFTAFAGLAAILATTWQLSAGWLTIRHLWWAWVVVMLYAVAEELTQPYVGRQASVLDWLADAAGAMVGLALFVLVRNRLQAAG